MRKEIKNQTEERTIDKFRGCLIGGAAGDALGYAVEFLSEYSIRNLYGEGGIREYHLSGGVAEISDDTQMTLFTANGLLISTTRAMVRGIGGNHPFYIAHAYGDWYRTQTEHNPPAEPTQHSWLINMPEMFSQRAPGNTCLFSISGYLSNPGFQYGRIDRPINQSKGCGGVMRVAPVGLYFSGTRLEIEHSDFIAAEASAITHGHELGYIPAAALAHIVRTVSENGDADLLSAVEDSVKKTKKLFSDAEHIEEFVDIMNKAIALSKTQTPDSVAIKELGEGWVAEEALAIAVYSALKHSDSFEEGIISAVNHSGDSDSTGAICGNILGAYLGLSAIPKKFLDNLELRDTILEIAEDLYHDCHCGSYPTPEDFPWLEKYLYTTYKMDTK